MTRFLYLAVRPEVGVRAEDTKEGHKDAKEGG